MGTFITHNSLRISTQRYAFEIGVAGDNFEIETEANGELARAHINLEELRQLRDWCNEHLPNDDKAFREARLNFDEAKRQANKAYEYADLLMEDMSRAE